MKSLFEAVHLGTRRERQNYMTNLWMHPNWPSCVCGNATSNVDHVSKLIIYLSYSQWFIFVAIPHFPFTKFPWHLPYMFHDISTHDGLIFSRLTEAADETGDGVLDREEFIQVQLVDVTSIILFYLRTYVGLCRLRKWNHTYLYIYIHIFFRYLCIGLYRSHVHVEINMYMYMLMFVCVCIVFYSSKEV